MERETKHYWIWVISLTVLTFGFVVPKLTRDGLNIVSRTYEAAAQHLTRGESPYTEIAPGADRYKYAPIFAVLYAPLSYLSAIPQALCWAFLNAFFYWLGLCRWFPRNLKGLGYFGLVLCSMELNGPLLYQQANALLIGMCLLGLAEYRDQRYLQAGGLLAFATQLKLLPAVFLVPLVLRLKPKFLLGCALGFLCASVLPLLWLGPSRTFLFHQEWLSIILNDAGTTGILDVRTIFSLLQLPQVGTFLFVLIVAIYGAQSVQSRREPPAWRTWISLACLTAILLSPRTESPTFVFGAPAFLLLSTGVRMRPFEIALFLTGSFFMTLSYNDIWPKALWNPHAQNNFTKTLGAGLLWLAATTSGRSLEPRASCRLPQFRRRSPEQ